MTFRFLFTLLACAPLWAGSAVILHSGQRLHAGRLDYEDGRYVLHLAGGRIEISAAEVAAIERLPDPPASPPPAPAPAPPPRAFTPRELVTEAARRHGLPPEFVHSVASVESAYRPDARSPKGAIGVMQLMPDTARALQADPHDVEQNIDAGVRLLRELLLKFQDDPNPVRRALAAYNAGEGAVRKHDGVPPYRETQAYVEKVIGQYWKQAGAAAPSAPPAPAPAQTPADPR